MPEGLYPKSREVPRFTLMAEAEIREVGGGNNRLRMRISELSARGCYVDTLNPLPLSTIIQLYIEHAGVTCTLSGKVIYIHSGFGMGVLFGDIAADQRAILDGWLAQLAAPLS